MDEHTEGFVAGFVTHGVLNGHMNVLDVNNDDVPLNPRRPIVDGATVTAEQRAAYDAAVAGAPAPIVDGEPVPLDPGMLPDGLSYEQAVYFTELLNKMYPHRMKLMRKDFAWICKKAAKLGLTPEQVRWLL